MTEKQQRMYQWLSDKILERETRGRYLREDERADEAVFEKIAGNVYEIFRTVLSAADKACPEEEAAATFFWKRLEQIPSAWEGALTQARAHGDLKKSHVEAIKLQAVAEIRGQFRQIWEVTP